MRDTLADDSFAVLLSLFLLLGLACLLLVLSSIGAEGGWVVTNKFCLCRYWKLRRVTGESWGAEGPSV